jgi:hypothetical protein
MRRVLSRAKKHECELRTVRRFDFLLVERYGEKLFESEWKDVLAVKIGAL